MEEKEKNFRQRRFRKEEVLPMTGSCRGPLLGLGGLGEVAVSPRGLREARGHFSSLV
jgi:hypothetical protein